MVMLLELIKLGSRSIELLLLVLELSKVVLELESFVLELYLNMYLRVL